MMHNCTVLSAPSAKGRKRKGKMRTGEPASQRKGEFKVPDSPFPRFAIMTPSHSGQRANGCSRLMKNAYFQANFEHLAVGQAFGQRASGVMIDMSRFVRGCPPPLR